jgi:uncharacterized repeat protein (TIGR04076 family)
MSEDFWKTKVRITCEEKLGKCTHNVGDTFEYTNPTAYIQGLCLGVQDPARLWVSHCAAGIPSWEGDDDSIYRIHCISKKGTVWRLERVTEEEEA